MTGGALKCAPLPTRTLSWPFRSATLASASRLRNNDGFSGGTCTRGWDYGTTFSVERDLDFPLVVLSSICSEAKSLCSAPPAREITVTVYLPVGAASSLVSEKSYEQPSRPSVYSGDPGPGAVPSLETVLYPALAIDDHPFARTKILVVDDDFRNVFAITALLERGWAEVSAAESGADAIALLKQTPDIDIVLMDIMMPEMDGYAAIRAIRSLGFDALTIIAVTGKVVTGERKRCITAGANDYVSKPVNTQGLLSVLEPWLSARQLTPWVPAERMNGAPQQ